MSRLADVQRFIDDVGHARTPKGLEKQLSDVARDMGFDVVTLFHHVDLSRIVPSLRHMRRGELIGITTAPVSWSEYYRDHNFVAIDPRVLATRCTTAPFRSDEVGRIIRITPAQRNVMECQARGGLGHGFTVPIHFPGEPSGSCTFSVMGKRPLPAQNFAMAHLIANSAFQAGRTIIANARRGGARRERPRLTERQLQCTILVGRGLSECEIARRLGISMETVKRHLKEARQAYGVARSVQLVTQSLNDGQIQLRELLTENVARLH